MYHYNLLHSDSFDHHEGGNIEALGEDGGE